jgi:precorrin-2 methylase
MYCYVCITFLCFNQAAFADSGRLYIVGMGTVPDLLTIRGAKAIEESQVVMLESERDKDAWKEYIGHREVWVLPGCAWRYFGLDPDDVSDPELKAKVTESGRARKEIVDRILQSVREGKD